MVFEGALAFRKPRTGFLYAPLYWKIFIWDGIMERIVFVLERSVQV